MHNLYRMKNYIASLLIPSPNDSNIGIRHGFDIKNFNTYKVTPFHNHGIWRNEYAPRDNAFVGATDMRINDRINMKQALSGAGPFFIKQPVYVPKFETQIQPRLATQPFHPIY